VLEQPFKFLGKKKKEDMLAKIDIEFKMGLDLMPRLLKKFVF